MALFKRKIEKPVNADQEEVAGRIASAMLGAQRRSAAWLNTRASKLGKNRVIILMAVLGLGFGFWCLWLVIGVLF